MSVSPVPLGSLTLEPHRRLLRNGQAVPLGRKALDILSALAEANGDVLTKDELLAAVWPEVVVEENALHVHVAALRKALGAEAGRLKTIRGIGYKLELDGDAGAVTLSPPASEGESLASAAIAAADPPPFPDPDQQPPAAPLAQPAPRTLRRARTFRIAPAELLSYRRWLLLALVLALLAGSWAMLRREAGLRASDRIPVVVRPLAAGGSGDRTEVALAGGITDELIVRLKRIPGLRIGTAQPHGPLPGGVLRHAYLVEGSIRSSGGRLRVTARVTDPDGTILWSDTFDRNVADLGELQQAIVASIARALNVPPAGHSNASGAQASAADSVRPT